MELPSEGPSGALACYISPGSVRAQRFAWLAGPGLYRGGLDLASPTAQHSELDCLVEHNLLPLPLTPGLEELPIAVVRVCAGKCSCPAKPVFAKRVPHSENEG